MLRFGVKISQDGYEYDQILSICQEAERLGFDSFWLADHMYCWGRKVTEATSLEVWTTLSSLAPVTSKIRLGIMAVCQLFRSPALLAKMASTFDNISGARLELGMGACGPSTPTELIGYGYDVPRRAERLARLRETLQILKLLWTETITTFQGKYYHLQDAINNPKPIQKPHPPIWIGGEMHDILELTAEFANGWNCRRLGLEELDKKLDELRSLCSQNGRDFKTISKSWQGQILVADSSAETQEKKEKSDIIGGTPDQCISDIQQYADHGIDYFLLRFQGDKSLKPLQTFAEKVMPAVR